MGPSEYFLPSSNNVGVGGKEFIIRHYVYRTFVLRLVRRQLARLARLSV